MDVIASLLFSMVLSLEDKLKVTPKCILTLGGKDGLYCF